MLVSIAHPMHCALHQWAKNGDKDQQGGICCQNQWGGRKISSAEGARMEALSLRSADRGGVWGGDTPPQKIF